MIPITSLVCDGTMRIAAKVYCLCTMRRNSDRKTSTSTSTFWVSNTPPYIAFNTCDNNSRAASSAPPRRQCTSTLSYLRPRSVRVKVARAKEASALGGFLTSKCIPSRRANKTSRLPPERPRITACLGIASWDRSSAIGGFSEAMVVCGCAAVGRIGAPWMGSLGTPHHFLCSGSLSSPSPPSATAPA